MMRRVLSTVLVWSCAQVAIAASSDAPPARPAAPAMRPTTTNATTTTAPDNSPALAWFGDRKITQGQFDRAAVQYIAERHPSEEELKHARQQWLVSM